MGQLMLAAASLTGISTVHGYPLRLACLISVERGPWSPQTKIALAGKRQGSKPKQAPSPGKWNQTSLLDWV